MCHCGQLLFLSSNDRPVQSLDLAACELSVRCNCINHHSVKEAIFKGNGILMIFEAELNDSCQIQDIASMEISQYLNISPSISQTIEVI